MFRPGLMVSAAIVMFLLQGPGVVNAQAPAAGAGLDTGARTPDGQPDLQGIWTNATVTPLDAGRARREGVL